MRNVLILICLVLVPGLAIQAQKPVQPAQAALSPAEVSMRQANQAIAKNPQNYDAYNALAMALARRARETSDVAYYAKAEEALQKSFALKPENFEGLRVKTWLLLGRHEFAQALEVARSLNKKVPDDVLVYGFLTDANVELGNYKDAEEAAQWMLNLRPGNLPGLTRAAYLRELFGDVDGALELMAMAYQSTSPAQTEDCAWILTQIAHLHLTVGRLKPAEDSLRQALTMFPGYHYALGQLANVRIIQKRYPEAVEFLRQRYQAAPHAENLYALAESLELAGRTAEAKDAFAQFERQSLAESVKADNSNHELVYYYVDHAGRPKDALRIAQLELSRRHDVHTLDAYAWALDAGGQFNEAWKQIRAALEVGVRDASMLNHAGVIAEHRGDLSAARNYWRQSAELNSNGSERSRARLAAD
jgi:tetratricopeptide (TPR) repeat protein